MNSITELSRWSSKLKWKFASTNEANKHYVNLVDKKLWIDIDSGYKTGLVHFQKIISVNNTISSHYLKYVIRIFCNNHRGICQSLPI